MQHIQQAQPPAPQQTQTPIDEDNFNEDDALLGSPAKSIMSITSTQSPSPPPRVVKRERDTNTGSDLDDDEVFEVQFAKTQKTSQHARRPKAADYEVAAREVILSAANTYRALLASQGAFPTSSEELDLVKKSWKRAHDNIDMNPMALTPDIVRIVSNFFPCSFRLSFFLL